MAEASDMFHVSVAPLSGFDAELVQKAAGVIGKDIYTARLLLSGKIPKIIATFHSAEEAETAVRALGALGLLGFSCSDAELRKPFTPDPGPRTIKLGKTDISFVTGLAETKTLGPDDVFLILKGTRRFSSGKETTTTTRKLNITATLLTGMPMFRKVKEKTGEESVAEDFVRLYGRLSPDPLLEIPQNHFDYSFLGDRLAPTSNQNLAKTTEALRGIFPGAVFDGSPAGNADLGERDYRLIYFYQKTIANYGKSGQRSP